MGADHQRRLARWRRSVQHLAPLLALAAAGEPRRMRHAQRLQPADQLAEVLLGQDFGGRHQRALPAGVDRRRGGQRGHHRLAACPRRPAAAGASGASRCRSAAISSHHALLRPRSAGTAARPAGCSCSAARRDGRAAAPAAARARAWPAGCEICCASSSSNLRRCQRRVGAVFQRGQARLRRRMVQEAAARRAAAPAARRHAASARHDLGQVGALAAPTATALRRYGLRQRRARWGRPASARPASGAPSSTALKVGWTISSPKKPPRASPRTRTRLPSASVFWLAGIEIEEAQHQRRRVPSSMLHDQLAARAELHLAVGDGRPRPGAVSPARSGLAIGVMLRFVLVAQRQVQRQVDVAQPARAFPSPSAARTSARVGVGSRFFGIIKGRRGRLRLWENCALLGTGIVLTLNRHALSTPLSRLRDFDFAAAARTDRPASGRRAQRLAPARWHGARAGRPRLSATCPRLLLAGDLLVFNDTRVIKARLFGAKASGGPVEVLVERVLARPRGAGCSCAPRSRPSRASTVRLAGGDAASRFEAEVLGRGARPVRCSRLRFPVRPASR